jgi:NAD(P)-dependent dehydrogenase (short-subunit alcohol dehydrogenase family)
LKALGGAEPGPVATERLVSLMQKESVDRFGTPQRYTELTKPFPLQLAGTVEEIAAMVVLLASGRSGYTTPATPPARSSR